MAERQPIPILEPQRASHEGGNGAPGLPRTVHESAKPPPEGRALPTLPQKSVLNRAVERTRDLYERNGWVFLPLGEAGKGSTGIPTLQGEQQPYGGGINKPELHPPKETPLPFEPNLPRHEQQTGNLDPEMEGLLRAYAEAVAEGDPEYEKSLRKQYKNDPSFRETFDRFRRGSRGPRLTLTHSAPDFSIVLKKQDKEE
jgi:hypothetical protein